MIFGWVALKSSTSSLIVLPAISFWPCQIVMRHDARPPVLVAAPAPAGGRPEREHGDGGRDGERERPGERASVLTAAPPAVVGEHHRAGQVARVVRVEPAAPASATAVRCAAHEARERVERRVDDARAGRARGRGQRRVERPERPHDAAPAGRR